MASAVGATHPRARSRVHKNANHPSCPERFRPAHAHRDDPVSVIHRADRLLPSLGTPSIRLARRCPRIALCIHPFTVRRIRFGPSLVGGLHGDAQLSGLSHRQVQFVQLPASPLGERPSGSVLRVRNSVPKARPPFLRSAARRFPPPLHGMARLPRMVSRRLAEACPARRPSICNRPSRIQDATSFSSEYDRDAPRIQRPHCTAIECCLVIKSCSGP